MFGIGGFELFIIVVFIFVIFGPDKLPQIIKYAGLGIKKFRKAKAEMDHVLQEEIVDPVMKIANEPDPPKEDKEKEIKTENKTDTKKSTSNKTNTTSKKTKNLTTTKKESSAKSTKNSEKKGGK